MDKLVETSQERFWNPEAFTRDEWVRTMAKSLPAGSRVLDAGAGASKYRAFFTHCKYESQDFCAYQGPLVKYLEPIDYICEITSIPVNDASFDAVLCTEVFEHLVDPVAALREFARILKPGGRLWVTAPFISSLHMEPYHFYSGFTQYWYQHWLQQTGFLPKTIARVGGPGRSAVVAIQLFYDSWRAAERGFGWPSRMGSRILRALAKVPAHYVLPRLLPRFDSLLADPRIASGLMVAAERVQPSSAGSESLQLNHAEKPMLRST